MKSGMLNGHAKRNAGKTWRTPSWERPLVTAIVDTERMIRLLHVAQEMGGLLNVVLGRMEDLLDRKADKETTRSLNAILSQAQQLVLCQQRLDAARLTLGGANPGAPVSIERGLGDA